VLGFNNKYWDQGSPVLMVWWLSRYSCGNGNYLVIILFTEVSPSLTCWLCCLYSLSYAVLKATCLHIVYDQPYWNRALSVL